MKLQYVSQARLLTMMVACAVAIGALMIPGRAAAAGVVGNGTPASCTEAAFRAALAGGGAVTFNCGGAPHTIALTTTNTIAATTSIDGGGLISLSGGNTPRVFAIDDQTLNLSNITIRDTGGDTEFQIGITVENRGTLNVSGVTFINNNKRAILNAGTGAVLNVSGSRFEDNTSSAFGSAISNESGASMTISDSAFVNNRAAPSQGAGAISNSTGTATITRSVFSGNAGGSGGAIVNSGTMTISESLFTGNQATSDGGGAIEARSNATLNVVNTTISGNTARRGGGIRVVGPIPGNAATLTNVTLAGNTSPADAANQGGGNISTGGTVSITLRNTIVANPMAPASNCAADSATSSIVDGGGNLQFPGTSCGATITTADPKLAALEDNGGPTATHALAADSPAREAAVGANCPVIDERGVVRPQGAGCDIGAFEYGAVPVLTSYAPVCAPSGRSFTLTVNGANFITGAKSSRILVNGTALATTVVSPTQLSAVVPAGTITGTPGSTVQLAVQTPVVDGGTSASVALNICNVLSIYVPIVQK